MYDDDFFYEDERERAAEGSLREFLGMGDECPDLCPEQRERVAGEFNRKAAQKPEADETSVLVRLTDMLTDLRERTELLRGKSIKSVTLTLCEDYSGFLGAELHHGKDDVDAPDEFCACVFCGPEELLAILRGRQAGQWCLQDEGFFAD